jgi:hypothetical protein
LRSSSALVEVLDDSRLQDVGPLIRTYWSAPDGAGEFIEQLRPNRRCSDLAAWLGCV